MSEPRQERAAIAAVERAVAAAMRGRRDEPVFVGFSGGLDSTVLLHAAVRQSRHPDRVRAVHVNHRLHCDADDWQRHCESVSAWMRVSCSSHIIDVPADRDVEAAAREGRYRIYAELLERGGVLLLGHHREDQIETLLWRLILRGGGAQALSGMAERRRLGRGELLRPLLGLPRAALGAYAEAFGLEWIEDPSNADPAFDRSFLRQEILPRLNRRWPGAAQAMARSRQRLSEDAVFVALGLARAVSECRTEERHALEIARLLAQPAPARVLRHWLADAGVHGVADRALEELMRQLRSSRATGTRLRLEADRSLRRFRGRLYLVAESLNRPAACGTLWRLEGALELSAGRLAARRASGPGLDGEIESLRIGYARPGLRLRPAGRGGSRAVMRLLQEAGVPPWRRHAHPLLFHERALVAIPGVALDERSVRESGLNWRLEWTPAAFA